MEVTVHVKCKAFGLFRSPSGTELGKGQLRETEAPVGFACTSAMVGWGAALLSPELILSAGCTGGDSAHHSAESGTNEKPFKILEFQNIDKN